MDELAAAGVARGSRCATAEFPLKAGLLTSLGFGHVSGLIALVHPQAFIAALDPAQRAEYQQRANARLADGRQRLAQAMCGGKDLYERPADRRLGEDDAAHKAIKNLEADVLLSEGARLGADDTYISGKPGCQ